MKTATMGQLGHNQLRLKPLARTKEGARRILLSLVSLSLDARRSRHFADCFPKELRALNRALQKVTTPEEVITMCITHPINAVALTRVLDKYVTSGVHHTLPADGDKRLALLMAKVNKETFSIISSQSREDRALVERAQRSVPDIRIKLVRLLCATDPRLANDCVALLGELSDYLESVETLLQEPGIQECLKRWSREK